MAHRRFKSAKYVRRQALAFRIFGELKPLLDRFVLPVWLYEDGPPAKIVCSDRAVARRQIEIMTFGDMEEYEAYARPAPVDGGEGGEEIADSGNPRSSGCANRLGMPQHAAREA